MARALALVGLLALAGLLFREQIAAHARVLLLLSEQLPQIPIKPLTWVTAAPQRGVVELPGGDQRVVADLFLPGDVRDGRRAPGVILAMGIPLLERDRPNLLGFADTLARLGYVVLWPRSASLDAVEWRLEEPGTFARAVDFLRGHEAVDPERVSFFGVSIGASIALVAASQPRTAEEIHAFVAFGAYYDLYDYIGSLVTRSMVGWRRAEDGPGFPPARERQGNAREGQGNAGEGQGNAGEGQGNAGERQGTAVEGQGGVETQPWEPSPWAIEQAELTLRGMGLPQVARLVASPSPSGAAELERLAGVELPPLRKFDPSATLGGYRAPTFILHDRSDGFVPYVESEKLRRALPREQVGAFLLSDLFQHAVAKPDFSWGTVKEIAALYGFSAAVFAAL
jgi:acetyl esterase/lipase